MYRKIALLIALFLALNIQAQEQDFLEQYIQLGLDHNLKIDQQKLEVEKSYQDIRFQRGAVPG